MARRVLFSVLLVAAAAASVSAHLCIMSPHQRGPLDISEAGSHTCFRHAAPCGGQVASSDPLPTYEAGGSFFLKFQQNYNHYEVGYPGYLDIAFSAKSDPTSDDDFYTVAVIPDSNRHDQNHQQNFSLVLPVPSALSPHSVLRIRYNPHKPGESTFYQCADFAIVSPQKKAAAQLSSDSAASASSHFRILTQSPVHRAKWTAFAKRHVFSAPPVRDDLPPLLGLSSNPNDEGGVVAVVIDLGSSDSAPLLQLPYRMDVDGQTLTPAQAQQRAFLLDQIAAYDAVNGRVYYIVHSEGNLDTIPDTLFALSLDDQSVTEARLANTPAPINALQYVGLPNVDLLGLAIQEVSPGFYVTQVVAVSLNGSVTVLATTPKDDTFINFQWITFDPSTSSLYFLMGDENEAIKLDTRLFRFDATTNTLTSVNPDYSKYTFSAVQYVASVQSLVALSPGLYVPGSLPAWSLVAVDPTSGNVKPLCDVAPAGFFAPFFGGAIVSASATHIYARFIVPDEAGVSMFATIEAATCNVTFSPQGLFDHVHNLISLRPGSV